MTRALVTQLLEALLTSSVNEDNLAQTTEAITAAREYLATEPDPTLTEALAQSVEPYAVFQGLVDSGEHGAFNLDLLKMIPRGAYLYLHPPQRTQPSVPVTANNDEVICPSCCHQFRAIPVGVQQLMLDAGFEPPFKHPPQQAVVTSGERAELIAAHQELNMSNYGPDDVDALNEWANQAYDMLEADVQQAKQVPMTDNEIARIAQLTQSAEPGNDGYILPFTFARAIEAHHNINK